MKVKMLTSMQGVRSAWLKGEVYSIEDDEAGRLVAAGFAAEVEDTPPEDQTARLAAEAKAAEEAQKAAEAKAAADVKAAEEAKKVAEAKNAADAKKPTQAKKG